jgi:two-component system, OmpR family, response regulator RegX3
MASGRSVLLVVTADIGVARSLEETFKGENYEIVAVKAIDAASETASRTTPALIIMDRRQSPLQQIHTRPTTLARVPYIVFQPPGFHCSDDECIQDFEAGAYDVVCDQTYRELLARVRAILRREQLQMHRKSRYAVGGLQMDLDRHEVTVDGRPVELTTKEFQILVEFVLHPSWVFTRSDLLSKVWGPDVAVEEHVLDVHMHSLRKKIEADPKDPRYIVTVRGVGYKLRHD